MTLAYVLTPLMERPGIYSARWAGINKDFKIAMSNIEEKMKGFKNKKCSLCLCASACHSKQ